jgi:hypothetical protein
MLMIRYMCRGRICETNEGADAKVGSADTNE